MIFLEVYVTSSIGFVTFNNTLYNCELISILIHCRRLAGYDWRVLTSLMTIFQISALIEKRKGGGGGGKSTQRGALPPNVQRTPSAAMLSRAQEALKR